jgi:hypothetical protein
MVKVATVASEILINGKLENKEYSVRIGGSCLYVGKGEFEIIQP